MSPDRRIVITGMGVIAPNGSTLETFWDSIVRGRSAAGPLTRFPLGDSPAKLACELRDFTPERYMDAKIAKRLDRSIQYAVSAAHLAVKDSGIIVEEMDGTRIGIVEGTSVSNVSASAKADDAYKLRGHKGISMFQMLNGYSGSGSGEVAIHLGIRGHAVTLSSGSASGNDVMGYAASMIREDDVDVMVAGGAEAPLLTLIWSAFCQSRVMTRSTGEPSEAMRPFDVARSGFILGEGSAFVVLEELTHALSRGARIYAEVSGHGRACEAFHPIAPEPTGKGVFDAMNSAMRRAKISLDEVDYINAHGTATELNDLVETRAIKRLFGPHARRLGISSTKPITGHLMAAAGAIETVITALSIYHQIIPPTINLRVPDPECDLD